MATLQELANLIFPDINETVEDLERKYPKRNNKRFLYNKRRLLYLHFI